MTNSWNASLFGCFDDIGSCCYGYWCTPCLFGSNAEKIDGSNCVLMCCAYSCLVECYLCWVPHCIKREAFRKKYNLQAEPCNDFLVTCCCGPCALCQEAREIKYRAQNPNVTYMAQPQNLGYAPQPPNMGHMQNPQVPVMNQPGAYVYNNQMNAQGQF